MIYFNNNKIKWLILTAWGKSPGCFSRPANRYNRPSSWCHLILKKKTHTKILKKFHMIWFFFKYVKNNVVVSHFYKCFYKIYIQKNLLIMKLLKILMTFISLNVWFLKNFLLNQIISILITVYGMYFYSFLPSIICFYKYTFFLFIWNVKCTFFSIMSRLILNYTRSFHFFIHYPFALFQSVLWPPLKSTLNLK